MKKNIFYFSLLSFVVVAATGNISHAQDGPGPVPTTSTNGIGGSGDLAFGGALTVEKALGDNGVSVYGGAGITTEKVANTAYDTSGQQQTVNSTDPNWFLGGVYAITNRTQLGMKYSYNNFEARDGWVGNMDANAFKVGARYYLVDKDAKWQPYVGATVGFMHFNAHSLKFTDTATGITATNDYRAKTNFTYGFTLGADYKISDQWTVDAAVKWKNWGKMTDPYQVTTVSSGGSTTTTLAGGVNSKDNTNVMFAVGITYSF